MRDEDVGELGILLACRAQLAVKPEDGHRQRDRNQSHHHSESELVLHRYESRAEEVADAFERVLPAGQQRHQLEELRRLVARRHQLRHRLAAKLRQILCDTAKHLRYGHVHDQVVLRAASVGSAGDAGGFGLGVDCWPRK